jgi:queuine/archaeosine tRNA-ribosyltransferase
MVIISAFLLRQFRTLPEFDALLEKGIVISDNPNPIWSCKDKEVKRLYNWGQIQYTHSSGKQVESLEEQLLRLEHLFENQAKLDQVQIHKMFLNYSYLPEIFKKYL